MSYADKLKRPEWQKRRLQVLEYADWRCQLCGDKERTLHCHHSYYLRGKDPWQYPKGAIIALCEKCHKKQHEKCAEATAVAPKPAPANPQTVEDRFAQMRALLGA